MSLLLDSLALEFEQWCSKLEELGCRGLVLLHTPSPSLPPHVIPKHLIEEVLVIAPKERRVYWEEYGFKVVSPARIERMLGSEYRLVVLDTGEILFPNLIAAAAEMVKAPGALMIVASCSHEWNPGGSSGIGGYARYLLNSMSSLESLIVLDYCEGRVIKKLPEKRLERPIFHESMFPDRDFLLLPKALRRLAASLDQAKALAAARRFARGEFRTLLLIGDRGRGKSAALGLAVALLIYMKRVGLVTVTSPSEYSVQTMFRMLIVALEKLGVKHVVESREGLIYGVRGPWFSVRFRPPGELYEPGGLLVIDEAAAIGPHRLRMLARKARRLAVATTIHGYEGSGRVLAKLVEHILPEPMVKLELKTPIRYPPGDPLEQWLYDTFVLRQHEVKLPEPRRLSCVEYDGWKLALDPWLAKEIYSVLVEAHYRNEPDDLAVMLDLPYYKVYALTCESLVYAVAEVSFENEAPPERRMLTNLLAFHAGDEALELKAARIVRIAVRTEYQGKGLGSKLLRCVESRVGTDYVGAVFSRNDVLPFWLKNGYRVVYISPRFNKTTGEKNIVVVKPLSSRAEAIIAKAEKAFRLRLLLSGEAIYRDVPAEIVAEMLRCAPPPIQPPNRLTDEQWRRLMRFLEAEIDHEAAWDAIKQALIAILVSRPLTLPKEKAIAVVARMIQGKPLDEVAAITGLKSRSEVFKLIDEALRELLLLNMGLLASISPEAI